MSGWKDVLFGNFYNWSNYFRPLVVALFVVEERAFDVAPGPMHLVSLALHLANTLLVGVLCQRIPGTIHVPWQRCALTALAMLLYGLHPALTEPLASVSCQFELVVVFFALLGLVLHTSLRQRTWRAIGVGSCFFLAACAKESAVAFPLLVAVFDWILLGGSPADPSNAQTLRRIARQQWPTYVLMLCAGVIYLALRYWALGVLVDPGSMRSMGVVARFQMVAWLYVTYWRIFVWPMTGLGPMHEVDIRQFSSLTPASITIDAVALLLLCAGAYLFLRRKAIGALLAAMTAALLPVLHLIPVEFDSSLYHDRFAMLAIGVGCVLLPGTVASANSPVARRRWVRVSAAAAAVLWLSIAAANIRVTLPLWSEDTKLWRWVVDQHPQSVLAKNHLLSAYLERDDYANAQRVADAIMDEGAACPVCLVNVANLALSTRDAPAARRALDKAAPLIRRINQPRLEQASVVATAQLHELEGDASEALEAYRRALVLEPLDTRARMRMALLLARQGMRAEAQAEAERALALMAPDEREQNLAQFQAAMASAAVQSQPTGR
jgi:tetratricopeptide (TPR) repeat protein